MKLRIFSLVVGLILNVHAERESLVSEDVYRRVDQCIRDYYQPFAKSSDMPEAKALREKAFAGLDDRDKIRALAEWMFRIPPPTHSGIPSNPGSLLIAPEPVIEDYSELRKLMAMESDSRKFYQLYILAAYAPKDGHDFMVDRARGLFMEGVAADRGQSTSSHPLHSISMFCFSHITQRLRAQNQDFKDEVYPELVKLNLEARNLVLAQWLKANWPGCEDLEIPEKEKREPKQLENSAQDQREAKDKTSEESDKVAKPSTPASLSPWLWISAAVVLLAGLIGFLKMRKS